MPLVKKLFKDDFDEDIKKPNDYPYVKLLRFQLLILNVWPGKDLEENSSKYRILITLGHILFLSGYVMAGGLYVCHNFQRLSFVVIGHVCISMSMSCNALTRILITSLSKKCKNAIVVLFTKMHLFYHKGVSDYAMQTHKQVHFILQICTLCLFGQWVICMLSFNLIPVYRNYSLGKFQQRILHNATYEHSIYIEFPFIDAYTNLNGYLIATVLNTLAAYTCSSWFIMLDLMLFFIVFNLWGHYQILLHDLSSFSLPAEKKIFTINDKHVNADMYSEEELNKVSKKLKECIEYHNFITVFINQISKAFGSILFIYYTFYQTSLCLLLLECSVMTTQALMLYGPLTIVLFQQLIQLSVTFELIGSASEKLKDAVYGVPWEHMDIKNRRTVIIFLMNVQEPIHIKAMGLTSVGVTSMATIIKTSFTYFTILRSL